MSAREDLTDMFCTFIETEERELATGVQSDWYANNWHVLKPHLRKARLQLSSEILELFYVHLLRHNILPTRDEIGTTYAVFERAYRTQTRYMAAPGRTANSALSRFAGLLLFGFDDRVAVTSNARVDDYLRYRTALRQFEKYVHIAGMAMRANGLLPYARDPALVERICQALDALEFIQDDYYDPSSSKRAERFSYVELPFWAAILTLLLSPFPRARETIVHFKESTHLPKRREHIEILHRLSAASTAINAGTE